MFISWPSLRGLSHSTTCLYVNAVGFQCKIRDVADVSRHNVIEKALEELLNLVATIMKECGN